MESEKLSDRVSKEVIDEFRENFFKRYQVESNGDFEKYDVERLLEDDNYCRKFISSEHGKIDKACERAEVVLKWRKEMKIKDIKETNLLPELLELGNVYKFNMDKLGHPIVIAVVKLHKKDSEKTEEFKRLILFWVEKLLKESENDKISALLDCSEAGLSNMDIDIVFFLVYLLLKYYPESFNVIMVYDMPWVFNAVWSMIKPLLPVELRYKIKFVNRNTITEFMNPESIPERMGGKDDTIYKYEPSK